jgi:hypothetical protein
MKLSWASILVVLLFAVILTGCAAGSNSDKGTLNEHGKTAGFWLGLWQGFVAPFVFVISLFRSNINIYEIHNNGAWYNFGYLFGLACFFGKTGHRAAQNRRKLQPR